jgi:hypothetical protein
MKKYNVTNCSDCPFCYVEVDLDACGKEYLYVCTQVDNDRIIDVRGYSEPELLEECDDCRLEIFENCTCTYKEEEEKPLEILKHCPLRLEGEINIIFDEHTNS